MKRKIFSFSIFIIFQLFIFATLNAISTNEIKNEFENILKTKNFLKVDEQYFCIKNENENLKEITGLNTKKQITPASVSKIFITEMILSKYDPDYRFYTGAKVSKNTLYIYGGFDPFFETKDFLHLVNQITSKSKNPRINKIVFDKSFYINNSANSLKTKSNLQKIIKQNKFRKNTFSSKLQIISSSNLKSDKTRFKIR